MSRYEVFPDAEAAAGYWLRSAGIVGVDGRVYSSIPKTPTYPLIVVRRIGGIPRERHHLDYARLQVDVWADSKSDAHDIAQEARVALHELEGEYLHVTDGSPVEAFIAGVEDDLGLVWSPDGVTHRDRYVFGVGVYLHA